MGETSLAISEICKSFSQKEGGTVFNGLETLSYRAP